MNLKTVLLGLENVTVGDLYKYNKRDRCTTIDYSKSLTPGQYRAHSNMDREKKLIKHSHINTLRNTYISYIGFLQDLCIDFLKKEEYRPEALDGLIILLFSKKVEYLEYRLDEYNLWSDDLATEKIDNNDVFAPIYHTFLENRILIDLLMNMDINSKYDMSAMKLLVADMVELHPFLLDNFDISYNVSVNY